MRFNEITDFKLIEFIRSHSELHDKENKNYRNYKLLGKLWTKLSKQMNLSVSDLKKRWKIIRSGYRQVRIKNDAARRLGQNHFSSYKYEEQLEFLKPHMKPYQARRSTRHRIFPKRRLPSPSNSPDFEDFTLETEIVEDSSNAPAHLSNDNTTTEQDFSNSTSDMPNNLIFEWATTDDTVDSKNHDANLTNSTQSNHESRPKTVRIEDVFINEEEPRPMPELSAEESSDEVSSFFQYAVIATKVLAPECQQNVIIKIFDAIAEARWKSHITE